MLARKEGVIITSSGYILDVPHKAKILHLPLCQYKASTYRDKLRLLGKAGIGCAPGARPVFAKVLSQRRFYESCSVPRVWLRATIVLLLIS